MSNRSPVAEAYLNTDNPEIVRDHMEDDPECEALIHGDRRVTVGEEWDGDEFWGYSWTVAWRDESASDGWDDVYTESSTDRERLQGFLTEFCRETS